MRVNDKFNLKQKCILMMKESNPSRTAILGNKSQTGFTLVEILIALTILAMGIISAMAYLPIALDASKKAADLTKATMAASKLIEEIKASSIDDISSADGYDTAGSYLAFSEPEFKEFEYKIEIANPGSVRTKDITVSVRWIFKGKQEEQIFKTEIFKYEPG